MESFIEIKKRFIIIILFLYIHFKILLHHSHFFTNPKISIFLPIYNKSSYLKNCIESLQKQTLKNIEIIAVNDGSTDDSLSLLKKLSKRDDRIKIINNDRNHGLLYSRAMGILNATGGYLMNLDPDDKLINDDDLETLYKNSDIKKYDIVIYLIKRIAVNDSDIEYFKYLDENQLKVKDDHITNKLIKKEVFKKAFDEFKNEIFANIWNYHEDNIWSYLVRKNANSISILNRYIYYYKRNEDSLNMKIGNELELKNRFYRNKKFKEMNYNNTLELSAHHSLYDTNKFNMYLKNREIRAQIIHVLVDTLKLYSNKTKIYHRINILLNKISENKIIIFYSSSKNKIKNYFCLLNLFKSQILRNKNILFVNTTNKYEIDDIKNYTYSNDVLILLDNLINNFEQKLFLYSYKDNNTIVLINGKEENNKFVDIKNYKIYYCNNK